MLSIPWIRLAIVISKGDKKRCLFLLDLNYIIGFGFEGENGQMEWIVLQAWKLDQVLTKIDDCLLSRLDDRNNAI